jgi:hypothetical protein
MVRSLIGVDFVGKGFNVREKASLPEGRAFTIGDSPKLSAGATMEGVLVVRSQIPAFCPEIACCSGSLCPFSYNFAVGCLSRGDLETSFSTERVAVGVIIVSGLRWDSPSEKDGLLTFLAYLCAVEDIVEAELPLD